MREIFLFLLAVAILGAGVTEALETERPARTDGDTSDLLWDGRIGDEGPERREDAFSPTCSAEASLLFGGIEGFVQTPKGGRIGSTSLNRPTLGELSITQAVACDSKVAVDLDGRGLYVGARTQQFTGRSVLLEDLITKNQVFPADMPIESYVGLDWYRLGGRHTFELAEDPSLTLSPSAEVLLFDFGYQLKGEEGPFIRRQYLTTCYRVGVDIGCAVTEGFSASLDVSVPLAFERTLPKVIDATLGGEYDLAAGRIPVKIRLGVGYTFIDYEDTQPIPNHIQTVMGPALVAGLEASF